MSTPQEAQNARFKGQGPGTGSDHPCPAPGCEVTVSGEHFMCAGDWSRVPRELRDELWRTWHSGEGANTPEFARAVIEAVGKVSR